ncbi:hypothetical protein [Sphingomonas hankookensis]|uniref:hypothetical protein n=1 Tax=Sphingomonas hankookensis TaxID=563996 RepID=UPI003D302E75
MHPGEMRQQEKSLSRMMSAQDMRQANEKRIDALLATPVATVSRQVRRHAHRTGRALPPLIGAEPKKARKPRAKKADAAQATVA